MAMAMMMMWEWIEKGMEWIQRSLSMATLWASLVLVSATTLLLFSLRLKLRKPDTVLLTGLSGSGKTVLFYQLRDGCCKQETGPSQEPNEGRFILHSETSWNRKLRPVHVVDLPGNSHLQWKMDSLLHKAAGIVFVVDATEILWNYQAVSKYLYDILTKAIVVKKKIPVLILCNKTDKLTAHTKEFIARQLEKEIDQLCLSRNGMSDSTTLKHTASGEGKSALSLSDCQTEVTVSEASGLTGEITQLELFIRENVKH